MRGLDRCALLVSVNLLWSRGYSGNHGAHVYEKLLLTKFVGKAVNSLQGLHFLSSCDLPNCVEDTTVLCTGDGVVNESRYRKLSSRYHILMLRTFG